LFLRSYDLIEEVVPICVMIWPSKSYCSDGSMKLNIWFEQLLRVAKSCSFIWQVNQRVKVEWTLDEIDEILL